MKDYGAVEVADAPGYHSARIGLRAPRVAVRVEVSVAWESFMALALSAASTVWGGFGFIYIPHRVGVIHPALRRILKAYDPDYLVDLGFTYGDLEQIAPGWIRSHVARVPTGDDEYAEFVRQIADQDARANFEDDGLGSDLCSPYREHGNSLRMHVLSQTRTHPLLRWSELDGTRPALAVPTGLDPLLTLALGKRAGFTSKPTLPIGAPVDSVDERLPTNWMEYALSLPNAHRLGRAGVELDGLSTAWDFTRRGLTSVMRVRPESPPIAVVGSTAEDFALATALDCLYGSTIWIPAEWGTDDALRMSVYAAFSSLEHETWNTNGRPIVTSISLSAEQLEAVVSARWPDTPKVWDEQMQSVPTRDTTPRLLSAEDLDLRFPRHLACAPADYDRSVTLPTRADGEGSFEYLFPLPPETPAHADLTGPNRPFWEVDVELDQVAIPPGRNLAGSAMLADDNRDPATVIRSGRDGISFNPSSMFFIPSGATLTQSIAKPRLHPPGLRRWVARLTVQNEPDTTVSLSQAGRRAVILTRLWGSRSAVARDLHALDAFLRKFRPHGDSDAAAYEAGDGVRLTASEGYLTLEAAIRTLPGLEPAAARKQLDDLLHINVVQRGLIIRCSECERRAFYRLELLGETNECPRCGAPAHTTDARRSRGDEPQWYYDLHGAVRELLDQNGDVPFLAGMALADTARTFQDIAELDFTRPGQSPDEIDILALVDGRLIVGEAKHVAKLGNRREANKSIAKLIRIADLLGADEILLATTAADEWNATDIDALLATMRGHLWRYGAAPNVRVLTNLHGNAQNQLLERS